MVWGGRMTLFVFFNDTATTEIYTLSLHDALPIFLYDSDSYADDLPYYVRAAGRPLLVIPYTLDNNDMKFAVPPGFTANEDRKSTRLNSSHANISYAVFCLKKKTHHILPPTSHHLR